MAITSPSETLCCLPPVLITAYMVHILVKKILTLHYIENGCRLSIHFMGIAGKNLPVGDTGKIGKLRAGLHNPYLMKGLGRKTKDAGQHLGGPDRPFGTETRRKEGTTTGSVKGQVGDERADFLDDRFPVRFPRDTETPRRQECRDLRLEPVHCLIG